MASTADRPSGSTRRRKTTPRSSGRNPLAQVTGVQVLGVGLSTPDEVIRNEDLAELGYDADWIVQRTGIQQRYRVAADRTTSDLATEAALRCLAHAETPVDEVDLILVATITPDTIAPSTACHVQRKLGATAPAMDVGAACAGFIYALVTGMQFVHSGNCRRVLVIGADLMSRTVDPADRKTFPLFGDGAGAVLLGPGDAQQGLISYTLGADGHGADLLCIPGGGVQEPLTAATLEQKRQFLRMDGRAVFKWAVRLLADSTRDVLKHAALTTDDLDLVVLHQANQRIIDAAVADLKIDPDKVLTNLQRWGNTSAASIPLVLGEAQQEGRLQRGRNILISGFGAGLAWGTGIFRW